jgi:hypothetical protein
MYLTCNSLQGPKKDQAKLTTIALQYIPFCLKVAAVDPISLERRKMAIRKPGMKGSSNDIFLEPIPNRLLQLAPRNEIYHIRDQFKKKLHGMKWLTQFTV